MDIVCDVTMVVMGVRGRCSQPLLTAALAVRQSLLTDNANVRLLQGVSTIQGSFMSGSADEHISHVLGAGSYVVRGYGVAIAETPYTLTVRAT